MDGLAMGDKKSFSFGKGITIKQTGHAGKKGVGHVSLTSDEGVVGFVIDTQD